MGRVKHRVEAVGVCVNCCFLNTLAKLWGDSGLPHRVALLHI